MTHSTKNLIYVNQYCTRWAIMVKNRKNALKNRTKSSNIGVIYCTQLNLVSLVSFSCHPKYELKHLHEICELRGNQLVISSKWVKNVYKQLPLTSEGLWLTNTSCHRACYAKFNGEPTLLQKTSSLNFDKESATQMKHSLRDHKSNTNSYCERRGLFFFPVVLSKAQGSNEMEKNYNRLLNSNLSAYHGPCSR